MKNSTDKTIIVATIAFTLVIVVCVLLPLLQNNNTGNDVSNGIRWDGNSIIANRNKPEKYIAIPYFTDVNFVANQISQKVNIYNPEENECIMNFSIVLSDGTVIWESDNTYPGYGFHDIELAQPLLPGVYEARLITRCFTMDKKLELNGSSFKFKINVIGD